MKRICLIIAVYILKIIYVPFKLLKINEKITYISRQSNSENLDFRLIRQEFEKKYPNYKNVVLTKKIEKNLLSKIGYCIEIVKQLYHIATSKIVIVDTYCITVSVLKHKKETKFIQIWHALGAIKKFGYASIDTPSGTKKEIAKIMHMHENYNYVLAPSRKTAEYYKKSFNVDEEKIIYIGMPRIDYIMEKNYEKNEKIYDTYPILKEKTNILYIPTFRKGEKVEIDELVKQIDTNKYNLIIKLHPLDLKEYKFQEKNGVIYEKKFKTYDLIKIADKVITDYSSLAMEAGLLNIPVYFYTYDIDKYAEDPGLNFNFDNEDIGIYKANDVNDLLKIISLEYDYKILNDFKKKYIDVNTNECTKQLVEFIMRLVNNEEIKENIDEFSKEKLNV